MAILIGVAEVLASVRDQLPGSVKFIFQPAEEGPPPGEEGGAPLVIKDGALENPKPDAIFGLHVIAGMPAGMIGYRSGPADGQRRLALHHREGQADARRAGRGRASTR